MRRCFLIIFGVGTSQLPTHQKPVIEILSSFNFHALIFCWLFGMMFTKVITYEFVATILNTRKIVV